MTWECIHTIIGSQPSARTSLCVGRQVWSAHDNGLDDAPCTIHRALVKGHGVCTDRELADLRRLRQVVDIDVAVRLNEQQEGCDRVIQTMDVQIDPKNAVIMRVRVPPLAHPNMLVQKGADEAIDGIPDNDNDVGSLVALLHLKPLHLVQLVDAHIRSLQLNKRIEDLVEIDP